MPRHLDPAVYIVANRKNGTLYTGVTSDLPQRIWQHRESVTGGFTARYGCKRLVWFEMHGDMEHAILREKQIKAGSRRRKPNERMSDWALLASSPDPGGGISSRCERAAARHGYGVLREPCAHVARTRRGRAASPRPASP